jgi:hypothetical protein
MLSLKDKLRSLSPSHDARADGFSYSIVVHSSFLMCFNRENELSDEQFVTVTLKNSRNIVSTLAMLQNLMFIMTY